MIYVKFRVGSGRPVENYYVILRKAFTFTFSTSTFVDFGIVLMKRVKNIGLQRHFSSVLYTLWVRRKSRGGEQI